jgi:hypothetical protein
MEVRSKGLWIDSRTPVVVAYEEWPSIFEDCRTFRWRVVRFASDRGGVIPTEQVQNLDNGNRKSCAFFIDSSSKPRAKGIHHQECIVLGRACAQDAQDVLHPTIMKLTFLISKLMPSYSTGTGTVLKPASTASAQNGCGACHVTEEIWTRKVLPSLGSNQVIELHHRNDRILKDIAKCQWPLSGRCPRVTATACHSNCQTWKRRLARRVLGRISRKPF